MVIPLPIEWAGILFMGFGVFLWFCVALLLVGTIRDWRKGVIEREDLKDRFGGYIGGFALGLGFALFGYLLYTRLIWDLLLFIFSPAFFPVLLVLALIIIAIPFLFRRKRTYE